MTPITAPEPSPNKGRPPTLALVGIGCGILFLACALLLGATAFASSQGWVALSILPTPTRLPTATPTITPVPTLTPSVTPTRAATPTPTPKDTPAPSISPVKFAPGILEADDSAIDPLERFPAGTSIVFATFGYAGLSDGTAYRTEWLLNGKVQTDVGSSANWKGGESGNWWFSIYNAKGISAGEWQLNLYYNNKLASTGKVTIEAAPAGANMSPIVFAGDKDANDKPVNPASVSDPRLAKGIKQIYGFYTAIGLAKGTNYSTQWFYNGAPFTDKKSFSWNAGPNDPGYNNVFHNDGSALLPGTYELKIWIGTRLIKVAAVMVSTQ